MIDAFELLLWALVATVIVLLGDLVNLWNAVTWL